MTLRDVITEKRNEMYDDVAKASLDEDIELIIDRIDDMNDRFFKLESELKNSLSRIEILEFAANSNTVLRISHDPPEPFPGYNDLLKESIPVIKAAIAEKKRELTHKVVPMERSDFVEREGNRMSDWDFSRVNFKELSDIQCDNLMKILKGVSQADPED